MFYFLVNCHKALAGVTPGPSGLLYLTRPVVKVSGRHGGQVAGAGDLARDVARDGDGGEPVREEGAGVAVVDRRLATWYEKGPQFKYSYLP